MFPGKSFLNFSIFCPFGETANFDNSQVPVPFSFPSAFSLSLCSNETIRHRKRPGGFFCTRPGNLPIGSWIAAGTPLPTAADDKVATLLPLCHKPPVLTSCAPSLAASSKPSFPLKACPGLTLLRIPPGSAHGLVQIFVRRHPSPGTKQL